MFSRRGFMRASRARRNGSPMEWSPGKKLTSTCHSCYCSCCCCFFCFYHFCCPFVLLLLLPLPLPLLLLLLPLLLLMPLRCYCGCCRCCYFSCFFLLLNGFFYGLLLSLVPQATWASRCGCSQLSMGFGFGAKVTFISECRQESSAIGFSQDFLRPSKI